MSLPIGRIPPASVGAWSATAATYFIPRRAWFYFVGTGDLEAAEIPVGARAFVGDPVTDRDYLISLVREHDREFKQILESRSRLSRKRVRQLRRATNYLVKEADLIARTGGTAPTF